ncbi:threonine/serine exporter family protein [Microbacterium sp. ASV81]|uniref:Threonine/serine exporter family protein n=1 Tax=Microbacterium capsulatum TaxID=3041921 RepID=A0ABU0XDD9_9MICO|nr:threonine/serine exporter family protein [Microbacterium sp. ASV81]MDQ4213130.1 threonine/serine exporter family protein [Microbacterium sp. ASV81]
MSPTEPVSPDVALGDLGALLLDAGVSVTDVRGTLERVRDAATPGEDLAFAVLPEHVLVSRPGVPGATTIASGDGSDLTFRQTAHASQLARRLEAGRVPLDQTPGHIAHIRGLTRRRPALQRALGGALLASGLALLFRCPWWAVVLALFVGALVAAIVVVTDRVRAAAAVIPFVASFVSTLIVGVVADRLDFGAVPLFAVCAPVALLVPGALITNALLELTAADIVTGASRLIYGLIMLGFMAAGIFTGAAVTGLRVDPHSAALVGETSLVIGHSGWEAVPPLWLSWVGVVVLAIGIGLSFGSGFRLTIATVIVMMCTYGALLLLSPFTGSTAATGITAGLLFLAARVLERVTLAVPATVSFQPAFLLLVPGTVGLVALASFDAQALAAAPLVFVSLCIGTKVGALLADALRITRPIALTTPTGSIRIIR